MVKSDSVVCLDVTLRGKMRQVILYTRQDRRRLGIGEGKILALCPGRERVGWGSGNELVVCVENLQFFLALADRTSLSP